MSEKVKRNNLTCPQGRICNVTLVVGEGQAVVEVRRCALREFTLNQTRAGGTDSKNPNVAGPVWSKKGRRQVEEQTDLVSENCYLGGYVSQLVRDMTDVLDAGGNIASYEPGEEPKKKRKK